MKILATTALVALLAGSIAVAPLVPALADDVTPSTAAAAPPAPAPQLEAARGDDGQMGRMGPGARWGGMSRPGGMPRMGGMGSNILALACGDRGAEALEIAFIHLQYSVKPTTEQAPLLDALKTAALADQKSFADTCKAAVGDNAADAGKKTILDRMQTQLALETAKVAALNDVVPKFKAFYDSLTDDQKSQLESHRHGPRVGMNRQFGAPWHHLNHGQPGPADANAPAAQPGDATPDATPDDTTAPQG